MRTSTSAPEQISGFSLARGWAADVRFEDILDAIAWQQTSITMFGRSVPVPRMTCWYGTGSYTYSGIEHAPAPMPPAISEILERVQSELGVTFNSVLANLYRDGRDSVSWHADDEPELGDEPTIASLSLGAARLFKVRTANGVDERSWSVMLEHGDLLVMRGRSQLDYQHSVPKSRTGVGARVNLTFRQVHVLPGPSA